MSIGLCLIACCPISYAAQTEKASYVVGDYEISLLRSESKYSGVTYKGKDGLETKISVPRITKAMADYYNSNIDLNDVDEVESEIEVAVVAENKLWFGLSFYGGEGTYGVGGVGFIDPGRNTIGILRHPALVDCSAEAIQVTPQEIIVLTYSQGELAGGLCNGLVRIDRKTFDSTIQMPDKKIGTLWDKDGGLTKEEEFVAQQYKTAKGDLVVHFKDWSSRPGSSLSPQELIEFNLIGADQFMLKQAAREYRWFDQAVGVGKLVFDQRCIWNATDKQPSCNPSLKTARPYMDQGEFTHLDMFESMVHVGTATRYGCTPAGWITFSVPTDKKFYGMGNKWMYDFMLAPGRKKYPDVDEINESKYAKQETMRLGYVSTSSSQGKYSRFSIEAIETENIACSEPFTNYSGPAIKSITTRMQTWEINQFYVLPEIKSVKQKNR